MTVRYFAAARAAAGVETETVGVSPGSTVADLITHLGTRGPKLAAVLERCSFLCDGIAVRDRARAAPNKSDRGCVTAIRRRMTVIYVT